MIQSRLTPSSEQIIEPMLGLARCSKHHRIIVAGSQRSELMCELHRRGYARVATTTTCGLPDGQYDVAFIDWRQHSINALETTLDWLVHFLGPSGVLVAWLDPQEPATEKFAPYWKSMALSSRPALSATMAPPLLRGDATPAQSPKSREA
jgi:hypothetical protein